MNYGPFFFSPRSNRLSNVISLFRHSHSAGLFFYLFIYLVFLNALDHRDDFMVVFFVFVFCGSTELRAGMLERASVSRSVDLYA